MQWNKRRNILLEKFGNETIPRPLSKKSKLSTSLDQQCKVLNSLILLNTSLWTIKILKLSGRSLAFFSCKAFLTTKKKFGTSLPASCSASFLKKNIYIIIFYYLSKFHGLLTFTLWNTGQYVHCNCLLTRLWRHKFWN